ncbi:MAG: helix-turn-helix domain-containing protein [Alloprevotella sp.]
MKKKVDILSFERAREWMQGRPEAGEAESDIMFFDHFCDFTSRLRAARFDFMVYAFCTGGKARIETGDHVCNLSEGDLLVAIGRQVFELRECTADFDGMCLIVSRRLSEDSLNGLQYLWPYMLHIFREPVLRLQPGERALIRLQLQQLRLRLQAGGGRFRRETTLEMLRIFYFDLCDMLEARAPGCEAMSAGNSGVLFAGFLRLLTENFKEQRSLAWYSGQMCLTPKYLSEVVKRISGRTAGEWITFMVMNELMRLLRHTDLPIKTIAVQMNFPSQSFLGKYFRKYKGMSPSEYRAKV